MRTLLHQVKYSVNQLSTKSLVVVCVPNEIHSAESQSILWPVYKWRSEMWFMVSPFLVTFLLSDFCQWKELAPYIPTLISSLTESFCWHRQRVREDFFHDCIEMEAIKRR